MLKNLSRKKLFIASIVFIIFVIISGTIFFLPLINSLSKELSKTDRVNANILLVEGWLPPYAIERAYNEFQNKEYSHIITTGLSAPDYYIMSMDGYLIFYPERIISVDNGIRDHQIEINAVSELEGENAAKFNVYVNDSLAGSFTAATKNKKYLVKWKGKLTDIDSIMVQFVNDALGDFGDRNLYVKDITIDKKITIPYQNNSEYDIGRLDGRRRFINNFSSYAQNARDRLISLGIDSSLVTSVPGKLVNLNRTLTSALAFRDWVAKSDIKITGINIFTLGTHSMRTWMTYNRILKKKYKIGIISLPDFRDRISRRHKILKTLRETVGVIYYWFILLPY